MRFSARAFDLTAKFLRLLFLLSVHSVLTQARAVLFNLKLFQPRFAAQRVVVVTRFITNEVDDF